jgi:hypothetical protein
LVEPEGESVNVDELTDVQQNDFEAPRLTSDIERAVREE